MNGKLSSIYFKFIGPLGRCLLSASNIPGLQIWRAMGVAHEKLTVSGLCSQFRKSQISLKLVCPTNFIFITFYYPIL